MTALHTTLTSHNNEQTTTTRSQQPLILDQSTMIGQSLVLLIVLLVSPSSSWIFQLSQQQKIRHSSTSNYKYQRLQAYSRRRFVHNSVSEDKHEGERKKEKESLGNVDLFAAGEKRHRDKHHPSSTTTIAPLKPSTSSVASSGKDFERKDEADVTTASSGGLLTAQAELLRMEAEKEALMVEQERLAERKEMLRQIDSLLLSLLRSLSVSSSPSDVIRVFVAQNKAQLRKEFFLRLAELANHEIVVAEKQRLYDLYEEVLQVLSETDASQYSQIVADVSKEINQEIFSSASSPQRRGSDEAVFAGKNDVRSYEQVLQSWLQQLKNETIPLNVTVLDGSAVANNFTSLNNMLSSRIFRLPSALPLDFVPDLMKAPTLTDQEVTLLKSRVFSKDLFEDLYDVEASPVISVVRGVPKGSYHDTLLKLQQRLSDIPELREKVQIVLYPEYKSSANSSPVSKSGGKAVTARRERFGVSSFEPVFIVFSKEVKPVARSTFESVGSVLSMLVGVFTAFTYSIGIFAFNQDFFNKALQGDPEIVTSLIPVTFGVLFLQLVHDLAHIVVARSRDVTLGFPSIVIPSLQIGVYGSVTRFLSFVKDRKDLFDVSIAGPLAGFLSSFGCTIAGLLLTATSSPTSSFPTLPLSFFQSSSLFFSLVDQYLHLSSSVAPDALVAVHPLVMIGYAGLVANALNFLPLGKLDGGRVLMSIIGRRTTSLLTVLFLFAQGISLIFFASGNASPLLPFWLITVAFLQRNLEAPPIDDVTPIPSLPGSSERDAAYWLRLASVLLCSVLAVGMLLPVFGATSAPPPLPPFPPLSPGGGGSGVI